MSPPLVICSLAYQIPLARLRSIVATWLVPGVAGVVIVTDTPEIGLGWPVSPEAPNGRVRGVKTLEPRRRGAWRNLAAEQAPGGSVVAMIDADCALYDPGHTFAAATLGAVELHGLVVYPPAWSSADEASRFLAGDASVLAAVSKRPKGSWSGTVALRREDALRIRWDSRMVGWGFEDFDFYQRACQTLRPHVMPGHLAHIHHPPRQASKRSFLTNKRIAGRP